MGKNKENEKMKTAAKALEAIISATDLSGQLSEHKDKVRQYEEMQVQDREVYENIKPQADIKELISKRGADMESSLATGYENFKKNDKNKTMEVVKNREKIKKEISENKKDILSKEKVLKKFDEDKKTIKPKENIKKDKPDTNRKEIVSKKFDNNKKEIEKKVTDNKSYKTEHLKPIEKKFSANKSDITAKPNKDAEKKSSDTQKQELKPKNLDKPKF